MMTPVLFFQAVMGMINAFQTFTQAYVMTEGGPSNATLFYVLYLYKQAFQSYKMGYACALAWLLFLVILALMVLMNLLQLRDSKRTASRRKHRGEEGAV